jgi:hypothetical protein
MKKNFTRFVFVLLTLSVIALSSRAQNGSALSYDGVDDFTTLPNGIVQGITSNFTIEAWVWWKGGDPWQRIVDIGNGTDSYVYLAVNGNPSASTPPDNKVVFGLKIPGHPERQVIGVPIATNTWTHIAVTVDYSDPADPVARLYINGAFIAVNGIRDIATLTPYHLSDLGATTQNWLGRSQYFAPPENDAYFNGVIDEVRISNIVRYPAPGPFTPASTFTTDANTVALFHFDEGVGQTTNDASANNFNAILGNTTAVETTDPSWTNTVTLPVYILQFDAHKTGKAVVLNWKVFSTGEGGQFVIERSTDGINFQPVGTKAIPTSQGTFSFGFEDYSYNSGKNYYRLKVMENYASVKYSSIVSVEGEALFTAYPTITSSQIFIRIPQATTIAIYSSNGHLMKQMKLTSSQNIDVSSLSKGSYQIFFDGSNETVRFVKL